MSGWTTLTVKANSEEDAEALRDAVASVCKRDDDAWVKNETGVRALDLGYGDNVSPVLKKHSERWSDAIVMQCNDTSDSGSGVYFTSDGTEVEEVHNANGYEGARGHDAAGELRGKAGFAPYMR